MIDQTYLIKENRRVDLRQADEGWRFDVQELVDGKWETMSDASYCTQLPVDIDFATTQKALHWIMDETFGINDVKKICKELSWLSPEWFKEPELQRF